MKNAIKVPKLPAGSYEFTFYERGEGDQGSCWTNTLNNEQDVGKGVGKTCRTKHGNGIPPSELPSRDKRGTGGPSLPPLHENPVH